MPTITPTTTREQWLATAFRRAVNTLTEGVTWPAFERALDDTIVLPSFPSRSHRGGVALHDRRDDTERGNVLCVSPHLADNVEVAAVVFYLAARWVTNRRFTPARPAAAERDALTRAGFTGPRFDRVNPTPDALAAIEHLAASVALTHGDYPAAPIAEDTRRTAPTRLLRVACPDTDHETYVLRMSQRQIDRGLPYCGICTRRMTPTPTPSA